MRWSQGKGLVLSVHRSQPFSPHVIVADIDQFDVAGIVVSHNFERLLIAAQLHCDRLVFFLGLGRGRQHLAPRLSAFRIRRAGTDGAVTVDEELAEVTTCRQDL